MQQAFLQVAIFVADREDPNPHERERKLYTVAVLYAVNKLRI
jgi:hypothetical protein